MVDIKQLLKDLQASPYEEIVVLAPHSGRVEFQVHDVGTKVFGAFGSWNEKPGTLLAMLDRENNKKPICAQQKGEVVHIHTELQGSYVQAGTELIRLRHPLTKEEVLQILLQKTLNLFCAPEKGKYYFVTEVDNKIKSKGVQSVRVRPGMDLFILSRMKREVALPYSGPEGIIYTVYFQPDENVDAGAPLIGICPADRLGSIQEVVSRVQSEWKELE